MVKMFDGLTYRLVAFKTAKGTFTLVGTDKDWNDEFKNIDTGEYHTWNRKTIKSWYEQGKITPVPEATHPMWLETHRNRGRIKRNSKKV